MRPTLITLLHPSHAPTLNPPTRPLTLPQARQWCLLHVSVNSQVQIMHMVARRSGIQMGALEPSGAPVSRPAPSACNGEVQGQPHAAMGGMLGSGGAHTSSRLLLEMKVIFFLVWSLMALEMASSHSSRSEAELRGGGERQSW